MPTAANAKLQYEAGQTPVAMSALTDSGDHQNFTCAASQWSLRSGFAPVVRPDGLINDISVIPGVSGSDDVVDASAVSCYIAGALVAASADTDVSITRPASAVSKVNSLTITAAGAFAMVAGTDGATTAFSETRGAAGGPPLIPTTSIEVAQIRVTSDTSAPITTDQIFTVVGLHQERYDYPLWTENYSEAEIDFLSALPAIHTGPVAKNVYASYASPVFADVSLASDFVPPETSHSVSSTQIYGGTLGSTSKTLNQGTFNAYLSDGVTDALVKLTDEILWFKFYPDRYKTPYLLSQGTLGISRQFPAGDNIVAACTISAESEAVAFQS